MLTFMSNPVALFLSDSLCRYKLSSKIRFQDNNATKLNITKHDKNGCFLFEVIFD